MSERVMGELALLELTVGELEPSRVRTSEFARLELTVGELRASSRRARGSSLIQARLALTHCGRLVVRALLDDLPIRCWFAP